MPRQDRVLHAGVPRGCPTQATSAVNAKLTTAMADLAAAKAEVSEHKTSYAKLYVSA